MTKDYNAKLLEDYKEIRGKVERGMLPLVARLPAIEKAVSEYVLARDEHLESKRNPPIAYRDEKALERFADLVLYEELKWSHPDKMTIVEYPVMSDRQSKSYYEEHTHKGDLQFGDLRFLGKRKTVTEQKDGSHSVKYNRVLNTGNDEIDAAIDRIDVQRALEGAGLTNKQREAITLVYFGNEGEGMTQAEAGEIMGVSQQAIGNYLRYSIEKLRSFVVKP